MRAREILWMFTSCSVSQSNILNMNIKFVLMYLFLLTAQLFQTDKSVCVCVLTAK